MSAIINEPFDGKTQEFSTVDKDDEPQSLLVPELLCGNNVVSTSGDGLGGIPPEKGALTNLTHDNLKGKIR